MDSNNIITAPQIKSVDKIYRLWRTGHTGSLRRFYAFMTSPTAERDRFVAECGSEADFDNGILSIILKENRQ